MCSSCSAEICSVSKSRRPMRVLLPPPTEPAVAKRSRSGGRPRWCLPLRPPPALLEGPPTLAIFHGCLGGPVVGAGLAALGDPGRRDLGDHVGQGRGGGAHGTRAAHVADGPVARRGHERLLVVHAL